MILWIDHWSGSKESLTFIATSADDYLCSHSALGQGFQKCPLKASQGGHSEGVRALENLGHSPCMPQFPHLYNWEFPLLTELTVGW